MLLVSGATKTLREIGPHPRLGYLCVPGEDFRARFLTRTGFDFAADNGCFIGLDRRRFLRMLAEIAEYGRPPRFVAAPDVVADAGETLRRFGVWGPLIRELGLPVALVGQDGLAPAAVPWADLDAFFVGGSTAWKLGPDAARLAREAKARDKWVHWGRVNSFRRMRYAAAVGGDSIDGGKFSRFARTHIPRMLAELGLAAGGPLFG